MPNTQTRNFLIKNFCDALTVFTKNNDSYWKVKKSLNMPVSNFIDDQVCYIKIQKVINIWFNQEDLTLKILPSKKQLLICQWLSIFAKQWFNTKSILEILLNSFLGTYFQLILCAFKNPLQLTGRHLKTNCLIKAGHPWCRP